MRHFDEDTILKYLLEVLEKDDSKQIRDHLAECEICSEKLRELEKQNNLIAGYNPRIENVYVPINKEKNYYSVWLKRAAILVIGFLLGYYTSTLLQPEHVTVVEQYSVSKSPQVTSTNFTVCPFIDIYRVELDL